MPKSDQITKIAIYVRTYFWAITHCKYHGVYTFTCIAHQTGKEFCNLPDPDQTFEKKIWSGPGSGPSRNKRPDKVKAWPFVASQFNNKSY